MKTYIPQNTRNGVSVVVRSRACHADGTCITKWQRVIGSNLHSRIVLDLRSSDESAVHRVAALVLLQSGGEAHFSRTLYDSFDRLAPSPLFFGEVVLPPETEIVL